MTATLLPARTSGAAQVVSLSSMRAARRAAVFLRGCLHEPAWLRGVTVEVVGDEARVLVVLAWDAVLIRRCLPTAVNHVPVHVAVEPDG